MDINLLLSAGMGACGRVLRLLPKTGDTGIKSERAYMMKILREETLPSLNILHPIIIKKTFSTHELHPIEINDPNLVDTQIPMHQMLDDRYSKYRIPPEIVDGHEVMTIKSCVPVSANCGYMGDGFNGSTYYNNRAWNNRMGRATSGDLYGAALAANVSYADRQLLGSIARNFRFYFYPPNVLMITNYIGPLNASFCLKNDENLISLDDMAYDGAKQLFILDLKKRIYSEFGNYTEVDTQFGLLDLKISSWESAEDARNELFATFRSTSHFRTSSMRS